MPTKHSSRHNSHSSSRRGRGTEQDTNSLIASLRAHQYNTLTDLCRIERVAASASEEEQLAFQEPMTSAWSYYVNSNQMLNELRNLTRDYPFSSAVLDDAKWRVSNDPESNRSWNYAWLVLVKMQNDQMIETYAASEAANPDMWAGRTPETEEAQQLADCFAYAWNAALEQMLRHWGTPPSTSSY